MWSVIQTQGDRPKPKYCKMFKYLNCFSLQLCRFRFVAICAVCWLGVTLSMALVLHFLILDSATFSSSTPCNAW